jgi:hypothetical protein
MHSASTFVLATFWIITAILILFWIMACGVVAQWGEKQGNVFWRVCLLSFFLTPLTGLAFVLAARSNRSSHALPQTVSRS